MVDTMLREHGAFERSQDGNLRSRSRLIKCAKDTGHYRKVRSFRDNVAERDQNRDSGACGSQELCL